MYEYKENKLNEQNRYLGVANGSRWIGRPGPAANNNQAPIQRAVTGYEIGGMPIYQNTAFGRLVRWVLTPPHTEMNGYIIQEITNEKVINGEIPEDYQAPTARYWEAWRVEKGKIDPESQIADFADFCPDLAHMKGTTHDQWVMSDVKGTKGIHTKTGKVYFVELDGELPGFARHSVPDAHNLRATTTEPSFQLGECLWTQKYTHRWPR